MDWNNVFEEAKSSGGGETFIRLKDGEKFVGVFHEAIKRVVVWVNGKSEDYNPEIHTEKPQTRWIFKIYDVDAKQFRIWEASNAFVSGTLPPVQKKYDLDKTVFEVSRTGSGTETKYHVMFEDKISKELKEDMSSAEDIDVAKICGIETGEAPF